TRHLQAKSRQLETLLTTGQSLVGKLETQELFATLTRDTRRMMQARSCAFYLNDGAQRSVRCAAFDAAGSSPATFPLGDLPVESCLMAAALHTKHAVEFPDVRTPGF